MLKLHSYFYKKEIASKFEIKFAERVQKVSSLLEIPFRTLFLLKSLFFSKILLKLKEPTCYTRSRNQRIIKKWRVTNERKTVTAKEKKNLMGMDPGSIVT